MFYNMKKLFLSAAVVLLSLSAFAQDYKQNEVQFEVGEALNIYSEYIDNDNKTTQNMSPSLSLGYYRFATKNIAYGFTAGYIHTDRFSMNFISDITGYPAFDDMNSFFFAPTFKWAYYNKPNLQMYLGAQLGMKFDKSVVRVDNNNVDNEKRFNQTKTSLYGQFTAFGISYGRNFYIGGEIGFGYKGMINLTTGYRF